MVDKKNEPDIKVKTKVRHLRSTKKWIWYLGQIAVRLTQKEDINVGRAWDHS